MRNFVCHCLQLDNTTIIYSLFLSHNYSHHSVRNGDLQTTIVYFTRNITQGWLNSDWLSSALSCPFIAQNNQYNEHSLSRKFVFSPSRELYRNHLLFVHSHTCLYLFPSCLLLLVYLDRVQCICVMCIVYTLPLVAFAFVTVSLSVSFTHIFSWELILGRLHLRNNFVR